MYCLFNNKSKDVLRSIEKKCQGLKFKGLDLQGFPMAKLEHFKFKISWTCENMSS